MKKPEHLTFENYQGANSSHERSALVAEVFEYATKLDENFNNLVSHLNTRLANLNQHLGALDSEAIKNPVDKALDPLARFDRGLLKGKISELEDTLRLPALMVTTNFTSELCPCCNGTGKVEGPEADDVETCLACDGTGVKEAGMVNDEEVQPGIFAPGEIEKYAHTMTGFHKSIGLQDTCPSCGGTGVKGDGLEMGQEYCPTCSGVGTIGEAVNISINSETRRATTFDMEELKSTLNSTQAGTCSGYMTFRTPYTHNDKSFTLNISEATMRKNTAAAAILFKATTEFTNMDIVYVDATDTREELPTGEIATPEDIDALLTALRKVNKDIVGTVVNTDKGFIIDIEKEYLLNVDGVKAIILEAANKYSNIYLKNV